MRISKNPEFRPHRLPANNPFVGGSQEALAYQKLLDFQSEYDSDAIPLSRNDGGFAARWLGFLLCEVPVKEYIATDINGCISAEAIRELSELYLNHLLKLCKWCGLQRLGTATLTFLIPYSLPRRGSNSSCHATPQQFIME